MGGIWPQFQMHLLMQIPWIPSSKSFSHSLLPVRVLIFKSLPDLHFQPYLPNFSLAKLGELHYKLNFLVPSKLIYWNLIPRVMVLEVRSLSGTLMNGISTLIEETWRAPWPLPSCKGTARRQLLMEQKMGFTRHRICWCLDLRLSHFQNYVK